MAERLKYARDPLDWAEETPEAAVAGVNHFLTAGGGRLLDLSGLKVCPIRLDVSKVARRCDGHGFPGGSTTLLPRRSVELATAWA